ncbi:MAG: YfiR family protein [Caldimonas sp.]
MPIERLPSSRGVATLRRALAGCLAVGALALAATPGPASAQETLEAGVKAAYLYKFLAYVVWPAESFASGDAPQVIGVMGADDVYAELLRLVAGRQVNGHTLITKRIASGEPVEGVHALYVGRVPQAPALLASLSGRPILTVTDTPAGLSEGSALNFVLVQGRVRFEASLPAAERAGLKLSARLLSVAQRVVMP